MTERSAFRRRRAGLRASLAAAADDFGHIIHRTPMAVLKAGSVNDIVKAVNFARANGLKVAGRTSSFQYKGRNEDLRAIGRARAGQDFRAILRTYFPGTSVGYAD